MNRPAAITLASLATAGTIGYLALRTDSVSDGPALSVSLTNFMEVAHVNPAHRTTNGSVIFVRGDELHVGTNEAGWVSEVFCTNALVLRWPGVTDKCYDVQWTSDFVTWTNSHAWRVGADTEIVFLAPSDWPACFFRLRMLDCSAVTNAIAIPPVPPPPPMPNPPRAAFARL